MPMDHIHWSRPGQFYSLGISYPPERLIRLLSPLSSMNANPWLLITLRHSLEHLMSFWSDCTSPMLWFCLIPWCWFLGPNMMQRFILQIKHPVNSTWLDLYSLFCREFQGVLLHPLRFCARPHASVTADSNNQCCLGRFQQFFFLPWFLPQVRGVKEPSFQSHFRHRGCDSIIPDAFPSVGHSPFFTGLAWKPLRPSSLGHFLWRTKWLPRDNEGLVMAIHACGGYRKTPS